MADLLEYEHQCERPSCHSKYASWRAPWQIWYCGPCCERRTACEIYTPDATEEEVEHFMKYGSAKSRFTSAPVITPLSTEVEHDAGSTWATWDYGVLYG